MHLTSVTKYLLCTLILFTAVPALAQHPDDVAAVREKLLQERQEIVQEQNIDAAAKAKRLLELGDWQTAQQLLESATLGVPVKLAKARLAMLQNEFKQAGNLVQEVLKENPTQGKALLLQSLLQIQAWELDKAIATARQLLQANPKDEAAALTVGRILMLQKKYTEALAWAQKVQSWNPKNAGAYLLESDVYFWNQKPELAEKPLITSLTLDPFNADARFNYGYAIWRRVDATQLNDMAAQWELALELNPLHYVTHWHWGNGHTNLTYADYAQPEDEEVRKALNEADRLISENRLQEALKAAQAVQQQYPASVLPAMLRGSTYYMAFDMNRQIRLDSAQAIFQRILQKKKHYGPAHNALAAVIKQKQLTYLHNYDSLQQVVAQTVVEDPVNFAKVFPDVAYYPGKEVQQMVWSQLYESIVYFPFLSRQREKFVIPPLHTDLAIAMSSPYFRQATTFDNRQWMDIRGVGSGAAAIEYVVRGSYLERNVVLHEYVHLFHQSVFTDAEKRAVRRLYHQAMEEGRTLDYYSANNEHEYLAQTYPAYFEPVKVHPLNHKSINTTADLKAKDPALYTFLDELVQRQRAYLAGDKNAMASNWAQVYLNLAEQEEDFPKALTLLDTALTYDAHYQPALIAYASVKQQQKEYAAAVDWLQKAKDINPGYAPIYLAEAALLEAQKRSGTLALQEALKSQVALYRKAMELEDDLLQRAYTNQRFRELYESYAMVPEAIATAEVYVQDAPIVSTYLRDRRDEAIAYASWLRGTSQVAPEAVKQISTIVARKPQNYSLRRQYADVLAAQGDYTAAYKTLEEAQRILEASGAARPDYMMRMAAYQLQLKNKAAAEALMQPILSHKVEVGGEEYQLVGILADLGELEQAETVLAQQPAPETVLEKAQLHFATGRLLEAKNKNRKAIRSYEAALQANPYMAEVRQRLVQLLERQGKQKRAEQVKAAVENLVQL
ncbi:tetratricopeptide repeat protein [Pontibacter pamirensis]|uniref:tetratricopeptide repeat protein n=1 Tax=Pontibacter pamirensis TaxID=2562824 RepID=UPI00138A6B90|nr:tetratricopeptide repeat protein [Pontibacter pamirensis]